MGYDLLKQLFTYDPDSRLTAKEALQHKWFHEDPKPTWKFVPSLFLIFDAKIRIQIHLSLQCIPNSYSTADTPIS
jgi:hypothetical protein